MARDFTAQLQVLQRTINQIKLISSSCFRRDTKGASPFGEKVARGIGERHKILATVPVGGQCGQMDSGVTQQSFSDDEVTLAASSGPFQEL